MFNIKAKKEALAALDQAGKIYERRCESTQSRSESLFKLRQNVSLNVIPKVEAYVNSLANTPKEFEKAFSEYKTEFAVFNSILQELEKAAIEVSIKAGGTAVAGVAAGVGTAALMPTAAMAIATTFGTASTGTAISTLSGAAASKAALAWLGGGALAKGGAGIVGGKALLALSGPIGWGIGSVAILGGGFWASKKNGEIAEKATAQQKKIEVEIKKLEAGSIEIDKLVDLTESHSEGLSKLLENLINSAPENFNDFSVEQKAHIGALINHVNSLSQLLNKKVDVL